MPVTIGAHRRFPQEDNNNSAHQNSNPDLNTGEQDADSIIYFNLNTDEDSSANQDPNMDLNTGEQEADSIIYFNLNTEEQDVDSILYQNLNTDEQDVSSEIYNNLEDLRDDNNNHAPDILNDDRANDFDGFDGWNRTEHLSYNEVETQVRIGGHRPQ